MSKFWRTSLAVTLFGTAFPLMAQAPQPAPAGTPAAQANPNEIICEKQEVTGSRLGVKKVCKTRAEWADSRLQDRQEVERVQVKRGMPGN